MGILYCNSLGEAMLLRCTMMGVRAPMELVGMVGLFWALALELAVVFEG